MHLRASTATVPLPLQKSAVSHPVLRAFEQTQYGRIVVERPGGLRDEFIGHMPGPRAFLKLYDWQALDLLLTRGECGFAEGYVMGKWSTDNLPVLLTFGLANHQALQRYFYGRPWHALLTRLKNLTQRNSLQGSRRNILRHYDLGNEFYSLWLDNSMTYSCALFGGNESLSLGEAQAAKYRRILTKLQAPPGDHILEIGCGWGGFAEAAAREGLEVTSITISAAQKEYAQQRLQRAGLDHLAHIVLSDYRVIGGTYDHIVSIGMFEHVGEDYWPVYFRTLRDRLKPGGKAMVQTITLDEEVFRQTHGKTGFIEEYIFPGGVLPSKTRFHECAQKAGLECREMFTFGQDYALTLRHWLKRFEEHKLKIRQMGYDEGFIRMWRFYLASCIAAFLSKRTDVMQAELTWDGKRQPIDFPINQKNC